jgi:hypothetical protein
MTVSVKIQDRYVNKNYSHIDFHVFIDGECDGNLYRQTSSDSKFSKLLSYNRKNWSKAIRGKKREVAQMLINQIVNTSANFAIAIMEGTI